MFRLADAALPVTLRRWSLVALACAAVALTGCGGGSRAKAYVPESMVSFGDENSLIDNYQGALLDGAAGQGRLNGMVYTVNPIVTLTYECADLSQTNLACESGDVTSMVADAPLEYRVLPPTNVSLPADSSSTLLTKFERNVALGLKRTTQTNYTCTSSVIWVQTVAHGFGFGFKDSCPTDVTGAKTYASVGAKVAEVVTQVATATANGELHSGVLVTIMVGQNDILEIYNKYHVNGVATGEDASAGASELQSRAATMADAVRRVMATGAKVVLALTPDLGESPMAYVAGQDQALLKDLTKAFNEALYITQLGNTSGRDMAGVNATPYTVSTYSSSYVYHTAVCDLTGATNKITQPDGTEVSSPTLTDATKFCTTASLVSDGSTSTYLWADNIHFAPLGHSLIGSAALTRATNQF